MSNPLKVKISRIQLRAIEELTKENHENKINEVLFGGAKNGGKSFLGAIYVNSFCCDDRFNDLSFFIARHTRKDLIDYTIPTIHKFFKENGYDINDFCKYNGQTNTFHYKNKSRLHLIDTAYQPGDPMYERFGSMEMTGGWIEEGGEHDELAYENLKLSIGRQNNDKYDIPKSLLITCNPKKGWMKRNFYDKDKLGTLDPNMTFIKSLVTDNVFRASGSEDILSGIKNKRDLQRLRWGEWEYDDEDNSLVRFEKINDLFTNSFVKKTGNKFLSCDIALLNDRCVLILWDGFVITNIYVLPKMSADELQKKIKEVGTLNHIPDSNVIYDGDGIGDAMRSNSNGWIKFNNNGISGSPEYPNIKTRLAYVLGDMINKGEILIDCVLAQKIKDELVEEIQCLKGEEVSRKYTIITKDEMKKIIGRSPDMLDAIIMRIFFKLSRNC
jgi:phage terminase large subunit